MNLSPYCMLQDMSDVLVGYKVANLFVNLYMT